MMRTPVPPSVQVGPGVPPRSSMPASAVAESGCAESPSATSSPPASGRAASLATELSVPPPESWPALEVSSVLLFEPHAAVVLSKTAKVARRRARMASDALLRSRRQWRARTAWGLVAVPVGLERAFGGDAEVLGLGLGELGELHAQLA